MNTQNDNKTDLIYTVLEVAKILKVNKNTVYDLIDNNILKCMKLGSKKITAKSLNEFLEKYDGYDLSDLTDIKLLYQHQ